MILGMRVSQRRRGRVPRGCRRDGCDPGRRPRSRRTLRRGPPGRRPGGRPGAGDRAARRARGRAFAGRSRGGRTGRSRSAGRRRCRWPGWPLLVGARQHRAPGGARPNPRPCSSGWHEQHGEEPDVLPTERRGEARRPARDPLGAWSDGNPEAARIRGAEVAEQRRGATRARPCVGGRPTRVP